MYPQFSTSFAVQLDLWTLDSWHGRLGVPLSANSNIIFSAIFVPYSLWTIFTLVEYHFFSETRTEKMTIVMLQFFLHMEKTRLHHEMSLNIDMKIILPVKFSGVSFNLKCNSLTSWLSCNVLNPRKNIPLEFHWLAVNSVQVSVFLRCVEPLHSLFPCSVWLGVSRVSYQDTTQNLKKTQAFVRWRLMTCSIKDKYFHEEFFPINWFHSIDLILFRTQNFADMSKHLFHCEIFLYSWWKCQFVWVILPMNTADSNVKDMKHSPYHRMFFLRLP